MTPDQGFMASRAPAVRVALGTKRKAMGAAIGGEGELLVEVTVEMGELAESCRWPWCEEEDLLLSWGWPRPRRRWRGRRGSRCPGEKTGSELAAVAAGRVR